MKIIKSFTCNQSHQKVTFSHFVDYQTKDSIARIWNVIETGNVTMKRKKNPFLLLRVNKGKRRNATYITGRSFLIKKEERRLFRNENLITADSLTLLRRWSLHRDAFPSSYCPLSNKDKFFNNFFYGCNKKKNLIFLAFEIAPASSWFTKFRI